MSCYLASSSALTLPLYCRNLSVCRPHILQRMICMPAVMFHHQATLAEHCHCTTVHGEAEWGSLLRTGIDGMQGGAF